MSEKANVAYIYIPSGPGAAKQGVDDYFVSGGSVDDLLALASEEPREFDGVDESGSDPTSQSSALVAYIEPKSLFHSPKNESYVRLDVESHVEVHSVQSNTVKLFLQKRYFEETGKPPSEQALKDALSTLTAVALFDGPEHDVHVRVAEQDEKIYVDLANPAWEVVEIDRYGWRLLSRSPVYFRRPNGMRPLPVPRASGDINKLRDFINIEEDSSWYLVVAWMLQTLSPKGPYPILMLQGEQGSAKTTTAKLLKALLDPSVTAVRSLPGSDRDLIIGANNAWILAFDNLSYLNGATSDTLCRLSTGGGLTVRALYTDSEETIFDVMRPLMLNGITDLTNRADLLDRAIITHLPSIPKEKRKLESELWSEFYEEASGIFGGMLNALSEVLEQLPNVHLTSYPRMADFARFGVAVERALDWQPGSFMEAYKENTEYLNDSALDADPVAISLVKFMEDKEAWSGTATELLPLLRDQVDEDTKRSRHWPKTASGLGKALQRAAPALRGKDIDIKKSRKGGTGNRTIHIQKEIGKSASTESDGSDTNDTDSSALEDTRIIATPDEIEKLAQSVSGNSILAVDLETTGLDFNRDRVEIISISTGETTWLVDCSLVDPSPLFSVLSAKHLIFHNAQFDLAFLSRLGFVVGENSTVSDTMLMSQIAEG